MQLYLIVHPCGYCGLGFSASKLAEAEFEKYKSAYTYGYHECTSTGSSIFGGGPCCDLRKHTVIEMSAEISETQALEVFLKDHKENY